MALSYIFELSGGEPDVLLMVLTDSYFSYPFIVAALVLTLLFCLRIRKGSKPTGLVLPLAIFFLPSVLYLFRILLFLIGSWDLYVLRTMFDVLFGAATVLFSCLTLYRKIKSKVPVILLLALYFIHYGFWVVRSILVGISVPVTAALIYPLYMVILILVFLALPAGETPALNAPERAAGEDALPDDNSIK